MRRVVVIGGGAAGVFVACNNGPNVEVIVVEKNSEILNQINGEFRPFTMEMPWGEMENRDTN